MSDELTNESDRICGWIRLWHPKGCQVTVPLRGDISTFAAQIDSLYAAGFLTTAPGLEEGEEKETVGFVLHGEHEHDGNITPFVLLYSTNDALKWSFLKVYLNTTADQEAFEYASKMKLATIPIYVGNDKPQRGASGKTDAYIVPAPTPFGVVWKKNPKHNPEEPDPKKKKAARLFVRWAEQKPTGHAPAEQSAGHAPPEQPAVNHDDQHREPSATDLARVAVSRHWLQAFTAELEAAATPLDLARIAAEVKTRVKAGDIIPEHRNALASLYTQAAERVNHVPEEVPV